MSHILEDFIHFLDHAPTPWHAVREIGNRLAGIDFIPLEESEKWQLEPGKRYFVHRGGSLAAFSIPRQKPTKLNLIASHTDSPALKLKPNAEVHEENMVLLETEVYGAPLLNSWLNRDLAIAGRVIFQDEKGKIEEKLIFLDDTPLFIPQLALHLDREVNEKGLLLNKQEHLRAIFKLDCNDQACKKNHHLESLIKQHLFFQTLLSFDLLLAPLEQPRFLGWEGEMIGSYRLDNLASAHACTAAIAAATPNAAVQMALFWDHEEIGSRTAEGAASPFLSDVLKRIGYSLNLSLEEMMIFKNNSLCTSVDVAHAFNPNFSKKYDPNHRPLAGKGIVLKYNADKKYASDARTAAQLLQLCEKLQLKSQSFVCRSDIPCGSTVGPIVAQTLGIPTVDIGCPIFSMHSAREVIACQDHLDMIHLLTHLLHS